MNELEFILQLFDGLTPAVTALLYFVFNCLVQSLSDPDASSTRFYVFIFKFAHRIAGNTNVARKKV